MNQNPYQAPHALHVGAQSAVNRRAAFIVKTYSHLLGALMAFTALEIVLFSTGMAAQITFFAMNTSWLVFLGGFMVVSWGASHFAHRSSSMPVQYAALGAYVLAQSVLFVPLLAMANHYAPGAIKSAAGVTAVGFAALTAVAFITRKDFSFLRGVMLWGGMMAMVTIFAAVIFGFELGTFFSLAMVAFAGAAILYDTSNVLHHFPEDRYVAAALQLFASFTMMLWYVIRLFMGGRD